MEITLEVWRGVGSPDPESRAYANNEAVGRGQWHTLTYPLERMASAQRAFDSYIRQGFHVVMVKPHQKRLAHVV